MRHCAVQFNTMQFCAALCNALQHNAVLYNIVQCNAVQCTFIMQQCEIHFNATQHNFIPGIQSLMNKDRKMSRDNNYERTR